MTGIGPPIPPDRQLDATDIRYLFDRLSSQLHEAGSTGHHLMIAGGAALALMWQDRTTHDIDVLEHRFRAPHHQDAERRTAAVDFISMRFSAELATAARRVAEDEGLPRNWLNGAVAIFTPGCDLQPQVLHRSDCLTVEAPSAGVLLAMKLHAAREQDLQDAARLARDTANTDPEQLLDLVVNAYGTDAATSHTAVFADRAVALALDDIRTHQRRFDRGRGIGP